MLGGIKNSFALCDKEEQGVSSDQANGQHYLVVVHTYRDQNCNRMTKWLISAGPATKHEIKHYELVNTMREEYEFSKGGRGKFSKPNAKMNFSVYLEADVLDYFTAKAQAKGVELNVIVNDLLKKDITLIEGVK